MGGSIWFQEENPDVGVGERAIIAPCPLSPASVVSPSGSFFTGSLCLSLCLQLGVSFSENRHCDPLWELKDPVMRKTGQGSYLSWGLSHVHIWEGRLGRVWKHLEMATQCLNTLSPGAVAGHSLGSWPLGYAATWLSLTMARSVSF